MARDCTASVVPLRRKTSPALLEILGEILFDEGALLRSATIRTAPSATTATASGIHRRERFGRRWPDAGSGCDPGCSTIDSGSGVTSAGAVDIFGYSRLWNVGCAATLPARGTFPEFGNCRPGSKNPIDREPSLGLADRKTKIASAATNFQHSSELRHTPRVRAGKAAAKEEMHKSTVPCPNPRQAKDS